MLRLLGLLGGLSVTMDLGTGAPLEESLKRCVVATRLARSLGVGDEQVRDVVYTSLLEHLGCTAYSHELGRIFGHDVATIRAGFLSQPGNPGDLLRTFVPMVAEASGRSRARTLASALTAGRQVDAAGPVATCEVAALSAARLGLSGHVQQCLAHTTSMWDGSGHPAVGHDDIPLATRLMHVASVATTFTLLSGAQQAMVEVRRRAGTHLDPALVDLVRPGLLDDLADLDAYEAVLDLEPDPVRRIDGPDVEEVARTFGDLADLKSPWLQGHSAAVAELAATAAFALGLEPGVVATVRIAGHLHDLGRVGVSSRIWAKQGPLSASERALAELHPWHTEQVLSRIPALSDAARLAGQHHERLDGSGFHRGALAAQLSVPSRVLATADHYRELVEERPGRPACSPTEARSQLSAAARAGHLDGDAVAAVLESAGHPHHRHRTRAAGLTERQVDVLRLLAAGRSNREIAGHLVISARTAEHHVQDIYARIGVSTRAGAAIFAMEHGLLALDG